jgi:phospholipid/cholesterol/gamma-HCH transport system ATP-binding protein
MSEDAAALRAPDAPLLELAGIEKAFGANRVLRGVDLVVERGRVLTILGGSGSGKSVLLKHMIGLLEADAGTLWFEGIDATHHSEKDWIELRKQVGYVFQGAALFDSLSVYENIAYPLREHERWPEARIAQRVADCLEAVGLPGVEALMPAELSGGMRKRVGVARAIALEPRAILYDEPTTGLDPANSRRIGALIRELQARLHVTSVVVTHDVQLCRGVSDRVALLADGVMVEQGTSDELEQGALAAVTAFLDGSDDPAGGTVRGGGGSAD